jgi:hypothetical protein
MQLDEARLHQLGACTLVRALWCIMHPSSGCMWCRLDTDLVASARCSWTGHACTRWACAHGSCFCGAFDSCVANFALILWHQQGAAGRGTPAPHERLSGTLHSSDNHTLLDIGSCRHEKLQQFDRAAEQLKILFPVHFLMWQLSSTARASAVNSRWGRLHVLNKTTRWPSHTAGTARNPTTLQHLDHSWGLLTAHLQPATKLTLLRLFQTYRTLTTAGRC